MKRLVPLLALSILLSGCAGPVIRPVTTPTGALRADSALSPSVSVRGLRAQIKDANNKTVIFFLHGMGDTCPGYAIDERLGWLTGNVRETLHIRRRIPNKGEHDADDALVIPDFDTRDSKSTLVLQRNHYVSTDTGKDVDAVEITWSGLDRWLKDNQLHYDIAERRLPSKPAKDLTTGDQILDCVDAVGGEFDQWRVPVNRYFKDGLMDRNLADVIIYVGSYGPKVVREFADAICRVIKDDFSPDHANAPCDWSTAPSDFPTHFMFVTHSLGSRIVYDTLLELSGERLRPDTVVLRNGEADKGKSAIQQLIQNTRAIYMMANQLPILGLAYAPPTLSSSDGPVRLNEVALQVSSQPVLAKISEGAAPIPSNPESTAKQADDFRSMFSDANKHYNDPILSLATDRAKNFRKSAPLSSPPRLDIVAFNDVNDLLSYSLPQWYNGLAGATGVYVTNVFVHNGIRWLWLLENPEKAHLGYITNRKEVWKIIACGAAENAAPSCQIER